MLKQRRPKRENKKRSAYESVTLFYGPCFPRTLASNLVQVKAGRMDWIPGIKLAKYCYDGDPKVLLSKLVAFKDADLSKVYVNLDAKGKTVASLDPFDPAICTYCSDPDRVHFIGGIGHPQVYVNRVVDGSSEFFRFSLVDQTISRPEVISIIKEVEETCELACWFAPVERCGCRAFRGTRVRAGSSRAQTLNRYVLTQFEKAKRNPVKVPIVLPTTLIHGPAKVIVCSYIESLAMGSIEGVVEKIEQRIKMRDFKYQITIGQWLPDVIIRCAAESFADKCAAVRKTRDTVVCVSGYGFATFTSSTDIMMFNHKVDVKCVCGMNVSSDAFLDHLNHCDGGKGKVAYCGCGFNLSLAGSWARVDHVSRCPKATDIAFSVVNSSCE
jgi:hypothetical protein